MITLFFEAYGGFCFFALIGFLVLAALAKSRPDLDEEEFDLVELEKLKQLVSSERSGEVLSIEPPIIEEPYWWSPPTRSVKERKRPIRRAPALFHARKPRII